jgi:hypothetical protein
MIEGQTRGHVHKKNTESNEPGANVPSRLRKVMLGTLV